jgi:hypothetical protein
MATFRGALSGIVGDHARRTTATVGHCAASDRAALYDGKTAHEMLALFSDNYDQEAV